MGVQPRIVTEFGTRRALLELLLLLYDSLSEDFEHIVSDHRFFVYILNNIGELHILEILVHDLLSFLGLVEPHQTGVELSEHLLALI